VNRRSLKRLWDARKAGDSLQRMVAGRSYESYLAEEVLRLAVERQFITIGEALAALRRTAPETARRVPEIDTIVGFRTFSCTTTTACARKSLGACWRRGCPTSWLSSTP
jgi:uncharacterized protein with HEPN domain